MAATKSLRLGFAGTPNFAAAHLEAILKDGTHQVVAVWTQPDRPSGRGKKTQASAVKQLAEQQGIPVLQPHKLLPADRDDMACFELDVLVVVAYGLILPESVLQTPAFGCINVHASLLPRWRGAAPIQRAIEAGDKETGVCIMQMDAGLDTGDVISRCSFAINTTDTAAALETRLIQHGAPVLLETLNKIASGPVEAEKQDDSQSCYAKKIHKAEAEINWNEPAITLDQKIRAFNPMPVAYTHIGVDRVRIWQAHSINSNSTTAMTPGTIAAANNEGIDIACSDGLLRIKALQLPGKKPTEAAEILRGHADKFAIGQILGAAP